MNKDIFSEPKSYFDYKEKATAKHNWDPNRVFIDKQVDERRSSIISLVVYNTAISPAKKGEQIGGVVHDLILDALYFSSRSESEIDTRPIRERLLEVLEAIDGSEQN